MKCVEAEKSIILQDSGELVTSQLRELEAHLSGCESCQQFQSILLGSRTVLTASHEPPVKVVQDILRQFRIHAPAPRTHHVFGWKPAAAMAAAAVIILGVFLGNYDIDKVGIQFDIADAQLLELEDQVVSVMYDGLSEDDLAFNFLMTFEDEIEG